MTTTTIVITVIKDNNKTADPSTNPDEYIRQNIGLFRLLLALSRTGDKGMSTMRLLHHVFHSTGYGWLVLKRAEAEGLIKHEVTGTSKGKERGTPITTNKITPKGRKLLKKLIPLPYYEEE
jgi:hypothetical protein